MAWLLHRMMCTRVLLHAVPQSEIPRANGVRNSNRDCTSRKDSLSPAECPRQPAGITPNSSLSTSTRPTCAKGIKIIASCNGPLHDWSQCRIFPENSCTAGCHHE